MSTNLLELVKQRQMRDDVPDLRPGDTVRVHARIIEGNKERVQIFEGVVISLRRGQNATSVTVRKISFNSIGVERTFLVHSPRIDKFEIVRRGRVRRAKLYYLRERQGKSARIKERKPSPRETAVARQGIPGSTPTLQAATATVAPADLNPPAAPNFDDSVTSTESPAGSAVEATPVEIQA